MGFKDGTGFIVPQGNDYASFSGRIRFETLVNFFLRVYPNTHANGNYAEWSLSGPIQTLSTDYAVTILVQRK